MADWERATALAGGAPSLSPGDTSALVSARVWAAVEQERRARAAVRARELEARRAAAAARVRARRVEGRRDAACGIARHFGTLADSHRAVEDALRPLPPGSALWVEPKLHESVAAFVRGLRVTRDGAASQDLEWAARFKHDPQVISARADEAAKEYEELKHDLDTICHARNVMKEIEERKCEI